MTERTAGPTGRQIQVTVTNATDEDQQRLAPTSVDVPQFLATATAITEHGLVVKLDPALTQRIKTESGDQSSLMDAGCIGPYPPGSQRC